MFCPHCGRQIPVGNMFCSYCGANLTESVKTSPQPTVQYASPCPVPASSTNVYAILGFIFAFFIPIAGLILSIIGLKNASKFHSGKGLSIAGIVISSVFLAILICYLFAYAFLFGIFYLIFCPFL